MSDHVHHWVVESPNGKESLGKCQECDEERVFPNWIETKEWRYRQNHSEWTPEELTK